MSIRTLKIFSGLPAEVEAKFEEWKQGEGQDAEIEHVWQTSIE